MVSIVHEYFTSLFSSSNPSSQVISDIVDSIDPIVDNLMNVVSCAPFSDDEVHKAVFDLHPSKDPGPDGFYALFYHKFWPIIGQDVTKAVLLILNGQGDISTWKSTIITLIPKIQEPTSMKDFRPISLCNTCYNHKSF